MAKIAIDALTGFALVVTLLAAGVCVFLRIYTLKMVEHEWRNQPKMVKIASHTGSSIIGLCVIAILIMLGMAIT